MNSNEKMILFGNCEGAEEASQVYQEIADLLSRQLPDIQLSNNELSELPENRRYQWRATLGERVKVRHLANALWDTYRFVLQTHSAIADKIKLVFKLQDSEGNFVRVLFCDPRSDKSIYLHCFEEKMANAFGRA